MELHLLVVLFISYELHFVSFLKWCPYPMNQQETSPEIKINPETKKIQNIKSDFFSFPEPRTEIVGEHELFVDSASSLNLTCLILSPDPPAYVFWKKEGKVTHMLYISK